MPLHLAALAQRVIQPKPFQRHRAAKARLLAAANALQVVHSFFCGLKIRKPEPAPGECVRKRLGLHKIPEQLRRMVNQHPCAVFNQHLAAAEPPCNAGGIQPGVFRGLHIHAAVSDI